MKGFFALVNIWLSRLYKTLAVLLVLFAVLLSCARIFLPYAHTYKQDLENYINEIYQGNLEIGVLSAGWRNWGPTLVVKDVKLTDSEAVQVTVEEINIGFDFWGSVKNRKVKINNFTLAGSHAVIDQNLLESAIEEEDAETQNDLEGVSNLLLNQIKRFSVVDGRITIKGTFKKRDFLINKLAWLNDGSHHQGIGKVEIEGLSSDSAKLVVDLNGDTLEQLNGQIYVEGNNIDLTSWFSRYLGGKHDQIGSNINFQSWASVDNGVINDIQLMLGETNFSWVSFDDQHKLTIPAGQISFTRQGMSQNYLAQSSIFNINFNGKAWSEFYIQTRYSKDAIESYVSKISLDNLWQLYPILKESFPGIEKFAALHVSGDLTDIQFKTTTSGINAKLNMQDLAWQYSNNIPGLSNLNGEIFYTQDKVKIKVKAQNSALDFNEHFSRPIPFDDLDATIDAYWDSEQWTLAVSDIALASEELNLNADVQYKQPKGGQGELSIFSYLDHVDASKVEYYLPLSIMQTSLVDYLNGAIYSGKGNQVAVLFNGPASNFPFIDNSGIFVVDADLEQTKYQFEQSWPAITDAKVNLNFTNDSMLITAYDGDLTGLKTSDVAVSIDSFSGVSILKVRSSLNANVESVKRLMSASPMADSVGKVLEFIGPQGNVNGTFSLDLPLANTQDVVAKGVINLMNNTVNLTAPEMTFDSVTGELTFVNDKVTTKNLNLLWRGMPLAFDVDGYSKNDNYKLNIDMLGNWQEAQYQAQIPESLKHYVTGKLDWQGQLAMTIPSEGSFKYQVDIGSSLNTAQLNLPFPYSKQIGTARQLKGKVTGDSDQSIIEVSLGDDLNFFGDLSHVDTSFVRSHLVLGKEKMLLPIAGFHITAELDEIEYNQWHELIFNITESLPETIPDENKTASSPLMQAPERIRGSVNKVDFYGQELDDISFNLLNRANSWVLQLNAAQARSRFKFYHDFYNKGLEIDADFIHLIKAEESNLEKETEQQDVSKKLASTLLPTDIPNVKFACKSCKYNQLDFGNVSFELDRVDDSLVKLNNFNAARKGVTLNLTGSWQKDSLLDITKVEGKFSSKDIEKEIEAFGFESGIKDSGVESQLSFNWDGGPDSFNFNTLDGDVKVKFDDGYLADVNDKGARLLSIFSFQSLVRKLSLDFRDIFSNGMFYEDMKGEFKIVDGVIYTDNTVVDATAGKLKVKGNTNLNNNKLDYKMSFAPKVTSSLPIIVSWMVNPLVGIVALAADKAIENAEVISVINFELTGTVDEPDFKEVDRKSRDINVGKSKPDPSLKIESEEPVPVGDNNG